MELSMPHALTTQPEKDAKRPLSVLILDDDEFDRRRLSRLVSGFAFPTDVHEAAGLYALEEMLDEHVFDAVLIDYNLVAGDGIDALDLISSDPQNNLAALVMIAGAPQYDIAVRAMKHGCDEFIAKNDLEPEALQKAVLQAVLSSTSKTGNMLERDIEAMSEKLAHGVAGLCIQSMQPKISRITRHLEILNRQPNLSAQTGEALSAVQQSCSVLREFLKSLEASDPASEIVIPIK
jgi:CheY-like chemotaxis protein